MLYKLYRYTLNFKNPSKLFILKMSCTMHVLGQHNLFVNGPRLHENHKKWSQTEEWVLLDTSPNWEAYIPIELTIKHNMSMSRPGNRVGTT